MSKSVGRIFHGGQNIGYLAMMIGSLGGQSGAVVMVIFLRRGTPRTFRILVCERGDSVG
jgi:hypothetical protein